MYIATSWQFQYYHLDYTNIYNISNLWDKDLLIVYLNNVLDLLRHDKLLYIYIFIMEGLCAIFGGPIRVSFWPLHYNLVFTKPAIFCTLINQSSLCYIFPVNELYGKKLGHSLLCCIPPYILLEIIIYGSWLMTFHDSNMSPTGLAGIQ